MGNSLQDQLLKAGLASKKQAVKARKAKNTKEKQQRKGVELKDETAEQIANADAAKREKDRELNQEKNARAQEKAIHAQIVQLINLNKVDGQGEVEYRFNDAGTIKTLMLSEEIRQQIINGSLSVVGIDQRYDLVPNAVARKIAERNSQIVLVANRSDTSDGDASDDDDYADYKIPDDLMW